ncbi:MAG: hypothetical protein AMXMBFR64_00040 [Myxococcales bacterium]
MRGPRLLLPSSEERSLSLMSDFDQRLLRREATLQAGHRLWEGDPGYRCELAKSLRRFMGTDPSPVDLVWAMVYEVEPGLESLTQYADLLRRWLRAEVTLEGLVEAWRALAGGPDVTSVLASHPHTKVPLWSARKMSSPSSMTPPDSHGRGP